jgi:hypothetical protein
MILVRKGNNTGADKVEVILWLIWEMEGGLLLTGLEAVVRDPE